MPLYICRWQNGDFSAAFASNREKADCMFDEAVNADAGEVFVAPEFMVHLKLRDKPAGPDDFAPFDLEGFGEDFMDQILTKAYPCFEDAMMADDGTEESVEAAIQHEKARLWGKKKPAKSNDPEDQEASRFYSTGLKASMAL
jgi:hypothetical protein